MKGADECMRAAELDEERSARAYVKPDEFKVLVADAKRARKLPVEGEQLDAVATDPEAFSINIEGRDIPVVAKSDGVGKIVMHHDYESIEAAGVTWDSLHAFRSAARRLKQTESDYRDAQQAYGEAVKRLSDEAVK